MRDMPLALTLHISTYHGVKRWEMILRVTCNVVDLKIPLNGSVCRNSIRQISNGVFIFELFKGTHKHINQDILISLTVCSYDPPTPPIPCKMITIRMLHCTCIQNFNIINKMYDFVTQCFNA